MTREKPFQQMNAEKLLKDMKYKGVSLPDAELVERLLSRKDMHSYHREILTSRMKLIQSTHALNIIIQLELQRLGLFPSEVCTG